MADNYMRDRVLNDWCAVHVCKARLRAAESLHVRIQSPEQWRILVDGRLRTHRHNVGAQLARTRMGSLTMDATAAPNYRQELDCICAELT